MDTNRDVVIGSGGCGPNVYVDKSFVDSNGTGLGSITINSDGILAFLHDPGFEPYQLDTSGIVVNGTLRAGDSTCPVGSNNPGTSVAVINFTDAQAVNGVTKGITVNSGGTLQLYGSTGVAPVPSGTPTPGVNPQAPSWTYLSAPAGPPSLYGANLGVASPVTAPNNATTITVADYVNWQPSQWIVVAGTDFSPDSSEFVMIDSVQCAGASTGPCTIILDSKTPLVNYHFGGPAPDTGANAFNDGPSQNYGVDERAEVGLISRNVKLTSTITGTDTHWGGEIKIMPGYNLVQIQGVEIEKFGKDQAGSYPIHFHMVGDVSPGTLINSNSIHHGFNHCITLHATNNLTISNNICARIVDHLFYFETGTETGDTLVDNLGVGVMSNEFSIPAGNTNALAAFWSGDYLAAQNGYGYNGFNIPFTDNQAPSAATVIGDPLGETSSGFWITNPAANKFVGNDVSGCQDQGRAFWILPPASQPDVAKLPLPAGNFSSNRAHGCYTGFDTASDLNVTGAVNYTPQGSCVGGPLAGSGTNCDVVTEFDHLTATRNRNRGIWVRPGWYVLDGARLATNRDGASLVSSGGTEGSPPGEWGLLTNSIAVGISTNNPWRFGPCPYPGQDGFGGSQGCWGSSNGGLIGNGYPTPQWNMFGYMFYDGPARLENVKFVNFVQSVEPMLTASDAGFLQYFSNTNKMLCAPSVPFQYEGDAAMGWFQSNENSYPPTQFTKDLTFYNVALRHEVYTQDVENTCSPVPATGANFRDGDKFTVIQDHDTTLTGLQVVPNGGGSPIAGAYPISLNNLPFLAGPGTVDECLSDGAQDNVLEQRPTSLMSPYSYATLEFSALNGCSGGSCANSGVMVFTKDEIDYPSNGGAAQFQFTDQAITNNNQIATVNCGGSLASGTGVEGHACVALTGRNGQGVYEPKLVNGLGYTVQSSVGMPNFVSLMYTDADLPGGISPQNPFQARIGICYQKNVPANAFIVYKGSKLFVGPFGNFDSLAGLILPQTTSCQGLDNVLCGTNANPLSCLDGKCPSAPFYPAPTAVPTPAPGTAPNPPGAPMRLTQVASLAQLSDPTMCPNGTCFYYDSISGLLFLDLVQEQPNAGGAYSSPLGSCSGTQNTSDPACTGENFYSAPGSGAELYTIEVDPSHYTPSGPSDCIPYGPSAFTDYTQPYPSNLNQLAYSDGQVVLPQLEATNPAFPHQVASNEPTKFCPTNPPATPDWPPAPPSAIPTNFTIALPAGVSVTLTPNVTPIPVQGNPLYPLSPGAYMVTASASPCTSGICQCNQNVTVTSTGWSTSGNTCCGLGGSGTTIGVAAQPWKCTGP